MIKIAIFLLVVALAGAGGGHRRRGPPRCGIPPFTSRLPNDTQAEIKKVWENYEDGEGCDEEHEKTKEIVSEACPETKAQ
ncbi:hypothetical protein OESDEN_07800 [Oesophagostomum dentatum]|uniref:Uncharacterized protein n=1 Tax=Oesophagostomum dentatum TaxID=61180 RepID=A0A0B1T926_OESDE|nr:hypothetical protein OESDEN_07800 [Oesophagostomum dentatum]